MLCLSYYCLFLLFNGNGEKSRTGSAWKGGGLGNRVGAGAGSRNDPNNVCICEKMNNKKGF
jgi:hypothetical protein